MSIVEEKVKSIVADILEVDYSEVRPEASIEYDLGADSLDAVELIMEFEKEFALSIPDEEAERLKTVADVISYIEQEMHETQSSSIEDRSLYSALNNTPKEDKIKGLRNS